jgi:hypothetical protein
VVKMPVSIKISEENYKKLCSLSGKLRMKFHKPVSINEAISYLYRNKLSGVGGSWNMADKEAEKLIQNLHDGWRKWKPKSA